MNVFYNENGVGDVLLVQLTSARPQSIITKTVGDVTLIYDETSGELSGFNIFNASSYLKVSENGKVDLT